MKPRTFLLIFSCLALVPFLCSEEAKKPGAEKVWIDPAKVEDPDFVIQGEYRSGDSGPSIGAQVWAQGDGKFEAVLYFGGLPGDGWDGDRKSVIRASGALEKGGKSADFLMDKNLHYTTDGHSFRFLQSEGEGAPALMRVERKSPTLGAKPPQGAVVLFDGKDASHFPGAKVTPDGLLEQGATSSDKFGDGTLHVEFMLSYKPYARGQQRGNSGVYLQSRYEVQVLDSFALEGKNNECGGIYSISAPKVNMCFPPLTWQTYDIDFTSAKFDAAGKKAANARMTIKHNGVIVQDNIEVPHITTSAPEQEQNTPGPLHLQDHKNPARYRNIWFLPK